MNRLFHNIGNENSFTNNIWLIYGMLVSTFVQNYIQQFSRSIDKMIVYSVTGVILAVLTAIFSFIFIPYWRVKGFVFAVIFANFLSAIYSFIYSKAFYYLSFKSIDKKQCIEMLRYSIPLIPNGVMWWIVGALNRPLMAEYLGMHAVGIFGVANKFPGVLSMIFAVFVTSWQISVLEEFGKKGYEQFYNKIFRFVTTGLIFTFIFISLLSKLIISFFTTKNFHEAWKYIPILTLCAFFSSISAMAGTNFSATRESKYFFYSTIAGAIVAILLNFILIPLLGIWGACLSLLCSFITTAIMRIFYAWKYVTIQNIKEYILMLLICFFLIGALLMINDELILYLIVAFLIVLFIIVNFRLKNDIIKFYLYLKKKY